MKWVVFCDVIVTRLQARAGKLSGYSQTVQKTLERFTSYRNLSNADVRDVSNEDFDGYIRRRQQDKWKGDTISRRTINNEIDILNMALGKAGPTERRGAGRRNLGLVAMPPYFDSLDGDDPSPVFCTEDQISAFFAAACHATTPRLEGCSPETFWRAAVLLDGITLLRRGSLLLIERPSDHDLTVKKQLQLPAEFNKTRRNKTVSLGSRQDLVDLFASLPSRAGEPLLPWRSPAGKALSLSHFTKTVAQIQRDAGIPDATRMRIKDLRSTGATLVGDGAGTAIAKRMLGHAPGTTTFERHYQARLLPPEEVAATDSLADRLMTLMQRPRPATLLKLAAAQ